MIVRVLATLLQTMSVAASPQAAPSRPVPTPAQADVVVNGPSLTALQATLDACLARHCPPKQDIAASLAYAEQQFVEGDYPASRQTLLAARQRNARYAAQLPLEVSGLHRANARLADLTGQVDSSRIGTFDTVDALRAGLSRSDERVLSARLNIGDEFGREGRLYDALQSYGGVLKDARRIQSPAVEGMALFRRAALLAAVAAGDESFRSRARHALDELNATRDPAIAQLRNAGLLIPVYLLPREDRQKAAKAALSRMQPITADVPLMLYTPEIAPENASFGVVPGREQPDWADVAFTVAADGSVGDVKVIQSSPRFPSEWAGRITRALSDRLYMPMTPGSAAIGAERIERYSFVSDAPLLGELAQASTTRREGRSIGRRIVLVDMSPPPPAGRAASR